MHLLDINVLIALCDQEHEHHERTHRWFHNEKAFGWATCPITENGTVRILAQPSYPNALGSTEEAAIAVRALIAAVPTHAFWPDQVSILDQTIIADLSEAKPSMITDAYLLALAVQHGARFATLDSRINPSLVPGGHQALISIL